MAPRLIVESGLTPEQVRPAASPVDTFAPTHPGSELAQLAQGLQQFAPALGRFTSVLTEREAQKQTALGEQQARRLEEQRITYRDAVKQGLIKASDNPWFLLGAKQQFGRAAAGQYARALQAAIATDPEMQASTDPADFDKFEGDFRKKWLDENVGENRDVHFEKGFGIVDGYTLDEGRRFAAAAGARMEHFAGERLGVLVGQVLDQHYKEGADVAAGLINAEIGSYLADNPKAGRLANKKAIEAVADWARLNYQTVGRADVESLLRKIKGGPGSSIFGTHEAQTMLNDVEKEVISLRGASINLAHAEEQRAEQKAVDDFWAGTNKTLAEAAKNKTLAGMDLTQFASQYNTISHDGRGAALLQEVRQSLLAATGNEEAYKDALSWINGVFDARPGQLMTMQQLAHYQVANGLTGSQYSNLVNEIEQRDARVAEGGANGGSKLLNDKFYQLGSSFISGSMLNEYGENPPENRVAAREAIRDFTADFLSHTTDIAAIADPQKRNEYVQNLATLALQLHAPPAVKKLLNKEAGGAKENKQALDVFEAARQKMTDDDAPLVAKAAKEYKDRRTAQKELPWTRETSDLLFRLGVPLDDKSLRLFFLEWERRQY